MGKRLFHRLAGALLGLLAGAGAAGGQPAHGIAMHGDPALPPGFAALPYANAQAPKGGRAVFAETGAFDSLNPFVLRGQAPWGIGAYTVETLLARSWDEPFTLYGLLAETVETPPDRSWVEFTLRPEARFSDGSPVSVADVLWSFEELGTRGHPRYRAAWDAVAAMEQTGPRSLRISFAEPNRELPLIMGLRPVLSRAQWEGRALTDSGLEPVIGSGPYVVASADPGRSLVLRRNRDWWARDLPIAAGLHNFDELRFDYYRNGDALWSAVRTGAVSLFSDGDPLRWAQGYDFPLAASGRLTRHEIPHGRPTGMEGLVFNTRRPLFADRAVREALALAFDWTWINGRMNAGQFARIPSFYGNSDLAARGPAGPEEAALLAPHADALPPGLLEAPWQPPAGDGGRNRANLRAAAALLEEAGWTLADGIRQWEGNALTFEVLVQSGEHETIARLWADALVRIGVEARVRRVDAAQFESRRRDYDYDMTVARWWLSLSPGTEQWLYFGSAGRTEPGTRNYMGVAEPAVDAMIRAALAARERPGFVAAIRALDRVLTGGAYVIPFGYLPTDRVAALAGLRRPGVTALYGFRPEVWWWHE